MTDAVDPVRLAVRRRQPESLEDIEDTITQYRDGTERSTYEADMRPSSILEVRNPHAVVQQRDALTDIAILLASLPLRSAMEMADAIVKQADFKAPATKIELALVLNQWAEERLETKYP